MVQLSDDCFAFGGRLLPLDEAQRQLAQFVQDLGLLEACAPERLPLDQGLGRSLATPLRAEINVPPFENSAVDGYAVAWDDLAGGAGRAQVVGRAAAGHPYVGTRSAGQAVQVFTGAPLPQGCDTVFMQEDVERAGDLLTLPAGLKRGANTRQAGEDLAKGSVVVPAGKALSAGDLGLAASLGERALDLTPEPSAVVFSSGDEVIAAGQPLAPGQLYDANTCLLGATLQAQGWRVTCGGILPDNRPALSEALSTAASQHRIIVTSGGVSTGEEDHMRAVMEALGELALWRIAIKPGRPVALGRIGQSLVVGLPGNPVAAYVGYLAVLRPLFHLLQGRAAPPLPSIAARATFDYKKKTGRREFVRARCQLDGQALPPVEKFHKEGAGMLSGLAWANGLVILGEDVTQVRPGDTLAFTPFDLIR